MLCLFAALLASRWYSHGKQETDEEFDARWVTYFNKQDIDAWELRKGRIMEHSTLDMIQKNTAYSSETHKLVPKGITATGFSVVGYICLRSS